MNRVALNIMNDILAASSPDSTVCLPLAQALKLAELGARELGEPLKTSIKKKSAAHAFQSRGLFSRQIRIVHDRVKFTVDR
jgi:hypothetical protein